MNTKLIFFPYPAKRDKVFFVSISTTTRCRVLPVKVKAIKTVSSEKLDDTVYEISSYGASSNHDGKPLTSEIPSS